MRDAPLCPSCGAPLENGTCAECERQQLAGLVQRETVVLAVLVIITVGTFFLTRFAAAYDRAAAERAAASWFEAGERALASDDRARAIAAFRQAALNAADTLRYQLTLAETLAADSRDDEARRILLQLREGAPENGEINLALARLAARHSEVAPATRYYHHAIYGVWNGDGPIEPARERAVRTELIQLLLDDDRTSEAFSQTLLLEPHLPDEADAHVEAGRLFFRAGSAVHALEHFSRAIARDSDSTAALAGALEAAFALGDYARAAQFLRRLQQAGPLPAQAVELAPVLEGILRGDPLAPRLTSAERARRLLAALDRGIARAQQCQSTAARPDLDQPLSDALALRSTIGPAAVRRNRDIVEPAFGLAVGLMRLSEGCGALEPLDRALLLVAQRHAGTLP